MNYNKNINEATDKSPSGDLGVEPSGKAGEQQRGIQSKLSGMNKIRY